MAPRKCSRAAGGQAGVGRGEGGESRLGCSLAFKGARGSRQGFPRLAVPGLGGILLPQDIFHLNLLLGEVEWGTHTPP